MPQSFLSAFLTYNLIFFVIFLINLLVIMPIALKFGIKISKIDSNLSYGKSLLIIFIAHFLASFVSSWFVSSNSIIETLSVDFTDFKEVIIFVVIFCLVILKELKKFKPSIKQLLIVFSILLVSIFIINSIFKFFETSNLNITQKPSIEESIERNNRITIDSSYSKDDQHVYLGNNLIIPEADPTTFKKTDSEFYVDKNHVFWAGKVVPGASSNSFKILNRKWGKDSDNLYFINRKIINNNLDLDSFKIISNKQYYSDYLKGYAKDDNNLYRLDDGLEIITDKFDYETFEIIGVKHQRDKNGVYFDENLIKSADMDSFEVLSSVFSKDKTHIFYAKEIFKEGTEGEISNFQGINNEFIKDDKNIYNNWKKIVKGADLETFKRVSNKFAKDKSHVYGLLGILHSVEPETFTVIGKEEKYGKDKNGIYDLSWNEKLTGEDLEKFYKDFPEFR